MKNNTENKINEMFKDYSVEFSINSINTIRYINSEGVELCTINSNDKKQFSSMSYPSDIWKPIVKTHEIRSIDLGLLIKQYAKL